MKYPLRNAVVGLTVLGLINIGLAAYQVTAAQKDDPLGAFPVQRVVEVTDTHVIVEGVKCADRPVRINGTSNWVSVDTPGRRVTGGGGAREHPGGCEVRVFTNEFPPEVLANPGVWHIVGTNCPIDQDGKIIGLCRTWETENFQVG